MTQPDDSAPIEPMPMANPDLFDTSPRKPRGKPRRPRRGSDLGALLPIPQAARPDHTAVYRFYDANDTLLYVGQSNNPLERYVEHRDSKPWWPDVAQHSIEWFSARSLAEDAETAAIKDEWPLHNIAHQPRGNGPYNVPSHVAGALVASLRVAVECVFPGATAEQHATVEEYFRKSFDPEVIPSGEIWFSESKAPTELHPVDIDAVIDALGSFRPPIVGSTRTAAAEQAVDVPDGEIDLENPAEVLTCERVVLNGMLLDNGIIDAVADIVSASDFSRSTDGQLFETILDVHGSGKPVDVITVVTALGNHNIPRMGGAEYLHKLGSRFEGIDPPDALRFARLVADAAAMRELSEAA